MKREKNLFTFIKNNIILGWFHLLQNHFKKFDIFLQSCKYRQILTLLSIKIVIITKIGTN
jgi:hypothetical protein